MEVEEQVLVLMKEDLPYYLIYLQNLLLACGYDTLSVIAKIDVPTDIDKMLQYINDNFDDNSM